MIKCKKLWVLMKLTLLLLNEMIIEVIHLLRNVDLSEKGGIL